MDANVTSEIWGRLFTGAPLRDLDLPTIDGRIDLRGLSAPEPTLVRDELTVLARIRETSGRPTMRGASWTGLDFSGATLKSLRFFDSRIQNCRFDQAYCQDLRMWGTEIRDTSFRGADLRDSALGGTDGTKRNTFVHVDFTSADLRGTAHTSADMEACIFVNAKLTKVDFQGTVFSNCTFAGMMREVLFYRHAFRGDAFPPNEMMNVDFSRATLRFVEFRRLDMDSVRWPEGDQYIILRPYVPMLDRLIALLRARGDEPSRCVAAILEMDRKWAGPNQKTGLLSKADLVEAGGADADNMVMALLKAG